MWLGVPYSVYVAYVACDVPLVHPMYKYSTLLALSGTPARDGSQVTVKDPPSSITFGLTSSSISTRAVTI